MCYSFLEQYEIKTFLKYDCYTAQFIIIIIKKPSY